MNAARKFTTENNQRQVFQTLVEHHETGYTRVTLRLDQWGRGVPTKGHGHTTVGEFTHREGTAGGYASHEADAELGQGGFLLHASQHK